jgi:DNA repair photolyase
VAALAGIAQLAAQSSLLEAKREVQYFELPARSILNRTKPNMPFYWTINPYRGCEFGCKYCYARFTHEYMGLEQLRDFEDRIYAKGNVQQLLRRDLRKAINAQGIAIGTATDPYQPAEGRFRRTRQILEVFAEGGGRHLSITTKSNRILQDRELLQRVAQHNSVHVNMTITTLDPSLSRLLEPRAPHPQLRLRVVRELTAAGLTVGVFPNPILPLITDQEQKLDALAKAAKEAGAKYFGGGALFLMPSAQRVFFPFLRDYFPHLVRKYEERYRHDAYLRGPYREQLRDRVSAIRDRHGLAAGPSKEEIALEEPGGQLELFKLQ